MATARAWGVGGDPCNHAYQILHGAETRRTPEIIPTRPARSRTLVRPRGRVSGLLGGFGAAAPESNSYQEAHPIPDRRILIPIVVSGGDRLRPPEWKAPMPEIAYFPVTPNRARLYRRSVIRGRPAFQSMAAVSGFPNSQPTPVKSGNGALSGTRLF